jgi:hypothetical protein
MSKHKQPSRTLFQQSPIGKTVVITNRWKRNAVVKKTTLSFDSGSGGSSPRSDGFVWKSEIFQGMERPEAEILKELLHLCCGEASGRSLCEWCSPLSYMNWQLKELQNVLLGSYMSTEFSFHNGRMRENGNAITLGRTGNLSLAMKQVSRDMGMEGLCGVDYIRGHSLWDRDQNGGCVVYPPMHDFCSYRSVAFLSLTGHFTFFLSTDATMCGESVGVDTFVDWAKKELPKEVADLLFGAYCRAKRDKCVHVFSCPAGHYLHLDADVINDLLIINIDEQVLGELLFFYQYG